MSTTTSSTSEGLDESTTGSPPDLGDDSAGQECGVDFSCPAIDLLLVIDNSGTMGEEQLNLARSFATLLDELESFEDAEGGLVRPNVNVMVTTTDMGHPSCTAFQHPSYTPREGAPVYTGCNARIGDFVGLDPSNPMIIEEACTENCPADVAPTGHFINFHAEGSNVPNDDVGVALACIGPQGINGCGYEAPLEAMLQALDPQACWNDPDVSGCSDDPEWADTEVGFLRDDATLAVILVTDELDCSVQVPEGYSFFTDIENSVFWNINPQTEVPQTTSAVCYNAGVSCVDEDGDGLYEGCTSVDNEVLHPPERYSAYFQALVDGGKDVVMLGLLGVPTVVHDTEPPFGPLEGGVASLLYRAWIDFPFPAGDILPSEWDAGRRAADKIFEFGDLGPGCTGTDKVGRFTGQALPPVRIREVCESLDVVEADGSTSPRCCIESICDDGFDPAMRCLTGMLGQVVD
ncbi:MAG: hypothetical protein AAF799_04320 [Myxococcota bacterium]